MEGARGPLETTLRRLALTARAGFAQGIAAEEFDAIVRLNQRRIYRVLLALLRDPDAADQLTQECFLRAYQKRASFRGEASVETWLVRIAVNLARDHSKNRRTTFWRRLLGSTAPEEATAAATDLADPHASPERALEARQEVAAVWSAADELSPQQRAVFLLRFVEEMPLGEIARAMGVEVGTVKSHLARAVGAIRRRLEEQRRNGRTPQR